MRALTQRMLDQAGYDAEANPAIVALADFAAQRSGIDWQNYYSTWSDREGRKAYQTEIRDVGADLKRFREALNVAMVEGVTDADVIAEAPHAFSGRLDWIEGRRVCKCKGYQTPRSKHAFGIYDQGNKCEKCDGIYRFKRHEDGPHWDYCTGQYFPTEYRKAAATLLEYAIRRVRQARPKESADRITSIAQLRALDERNGGCWFDSSSMRSFGTRIESGIIRGEFFITSDKRGFDDAQGRGYTVRTFNAEGSPRSSSLGARGQSVGDFDTKNEALTALDEYLKSESAESEAA